MYGKNMLPVKITRKRLRAKTNTKVVASGNKDNIIANEEKVVASEDKENDVASEDKDVATMTKRKLWRVKIKRMMLQAKIKMLPQG